MTKPSDRIEEIRKILIDQHVRKTREHLADDSLAKMLPQVASEQNIRQAAEKDLRFWVSAVIVYLDERAEAGG